MELSQRLWEQGFYVPAIRPPSVPARESLLRISLNHRHTQEQIDNLLRALQQARDSLHPLPGALLGRTIPTGGAV